MADETLGDGYIYVSYDHINNAADDMIAQTKAIETTIDNMERELEPLKASWYGSDAAAYADKQQAWNTAIDNAKSLLMEHKALLERLGLNYNDTEKRLTSLWGGH